MEITEAIQNIADAGDDPTKVSPEALKALAGYQPPSTDGLVTEEEANARAARDRKKAEAKNAKLMAELEELREQYEGLTSSASETTDATKQLERLQKQLEATNAKLAEAEKAHDATRRQAALTSISGEIGWHDGVDAETRAVLLERRFADLDTDDLAVTDLVSPIVREFKERNAALISGTSRSGTGQAVAGATPSAGGKTEISRAKLVELAKSNPQEYQATMKTVWEGAASGNVTLVA